MGRVIFKTRMINDDLNAVDMHFHTEYSVDGFTKIDKLINTLDELQIGVAITDHNEIRGAVDAYGKSSNLIIPGIEVTCKEGTHIIFYFNEPGDLENFYTKEVEPFKRKTKDALLRSEKEVMDFLDVYKGYNGVSCAPHPCCMTWVSLHKLENMDEALKKLDLLEVFTAYNTSRGNKKAIKLSDKHPDKGITGGSDGHTIFELGKGLTYAKGNTAKEFLESILNNESSVIGIEDNLYEKAFLTLAKETKYLATEKNLNRLKYFRFFSNIKIEDGKIKMCPPDEESKNGKT
ncbi:MAG: PHP domain-containing protein [Nanoarchaeota archaeon]|nr:PHP domain-containing protein [Nanoarchaeota archaeon]MCG2718997.1 PHP domain-containing protein [Nanoarchaeota archaeon]